MLFSHKAIGIEITQDSAMLALVGGKLKAPRLDAYSTALFPPDTVRCSLRDENVKDPKLFVSKIRDAYLKLLVGTTRIALSLPDTSGHVLIVDLETRFKSRAEGVDIIRWKLKKNFPFDVNELHIDYRVLQERESGEVSTLVSMISKRVVNQYEELIGQAGLQPSQIDFTTFNLSHFYSSRIELIENGALVVRHRDTVSILLFQGGILDFYRSKELSGPGSIFNRIFREINSSLMAYKEKYPGFVADEILCIAPKEQREPFRSVIAEASGVEPVFLDPARVVSLREGLTVDEKTLSVLSVAMGAAVRNL